MKQLQVYIPTLGRIGLTKQATLREFLTYSKHKPVIVCPPKEVKHHKRYYPNVVGCPAKGIGPTRQWILENAAERCVVMADDDMWFSYRPVPENTKLERCTNLQPLLHRILRYVRQGFIHGGVGARQGNNHKDLTARRKGKLVDGLLVQDCERVNNFHFLDREKVLATGARFDELPVMEDFHFSLTLITQGHANRVIHDYVWNQRGSGATGGCSTYRTAEVQAAGAEGLHKAFPQFVKVKVKKSKQTSTAWSEFKERKDVMIYWVKAAESAGTPF